MRRLVLPILTVGLVFSAAPAGAQAYDPNYPVCMQIGEWGGWRIECSFTSMAQCQASGSGRGATCVANPFFGGTRKVR